MATKVIATMQERTKRLVGTDEHLDNVLRSYAHRGDLVTDPRTIRLVRLAAGMSEVTVVLREAVPVPSRTVRAATATGRWIQTNRRPLALTTACVTVVAALVGVVVLVVSLVRSLMSGLAAVGGVGAVLGLLAVVVVIRLFAGGGGHGGHSGEGFHWSKCK